MRRRTRNGRKPRPPATRKEAAVVVTDELALTTQLDRIEAKVDRLLALAPNPYDVPESRGDG